VETVARNSYFQIFPYKFKIVLFILFCSGCFIILVYLFLLPFVFVFLVGSSRSCLRSTIPECLAWLKKVMRN
jgi:Sec-independent protein secretion pathway component TatC